MKGKIIVPLILASVSATMLATQNYTVLADYTDETTMFGDLISVSRFSGKGRVGEPITLPTVTSTGSADVKVTILDPRGYKMVDAKSISEVTNFTSSQKGYYTVKYSAVKDGQVTTTTEELKILVEGDDYAISLPTNSQYVIPAVVATNTEIKIPLPTVKKGDDELSEEEVTSPADSSNNGLRVTVASKDGASEASNLTYNAETKTYNFQPTKAGVYEIIYKYYRSGSVQDYKTDSFVVKDGYDTSKMSLNFSYKSAVPTSSDVKLGKKVSLPQIKVVDKNGTTDELDAFVEIKVQHISENGTATDVEVKDYSFVPMVKGNYRVTYKASIPLFGISSKTSSFMIENVRDNENPVVNPVNQYTYETVDGKTTIKTVYRDVDQNGEYNSDVDVLLYDSNSDEAKAMTEEKRKEAIEKALGNLEYSVPSVVVLKNVEGENKATVKLPAIFAADNFSDFSEMTYTRAVRVVSSNTTITLRKPDGSDYKNNEYAEYTFTATGDYMFRYTAQDKDGGQTVKSYQVKVVNEADVKNDGNLIKPTIEFAAVSSSVDADGKLTFSKPTATDKFDTLPETHVYYSFSEDSFDVKNEITDVNASGKLVLDLTKINVGENKTLYLHAVAKNDYNAEVSTIVRPVTIISNNDLVPPTFVTTNEDVLVNLSKANAVTLNDKLDESNQVDPETGKIGSQVAITENGMLAVPVNEETRAAFSQKDIVTLPEIKISDADAYLTLNVKVRDPYGKVVTVKNSKVTKTFADDVYTHAIANGTFTADYSGVYSITYTAKDSGGNIITKSFGVRVYDTEKPTINLSSTDVLSGTVEVGKFIEIPAATLKDNGVILTNVTNDVPYESRVKGIAGTYWDIIEGPSMNRRGTVGFTPDIAGTYIIKYTGWDANGNLTESKSYTITASDTIKPTITLENDYTLNLNQAWNEEAGSVEIVAPGIGTIYDGYRDPENSGNNYDQTAVEDITLTVKVTDVDGKEVAVEEITEPKYTGSSEFTTRYKFTANKQGTYTISYIATDAAGNSYELTKEVKVGDCEAPDMEWNDSEEDLISNAKINSYYDFNLDMVTIDGIKGSEAIKVPAGESKAEYTASVNLYNPSSSIVKNEYQGDSSKSGQYRWKFEESGTYELRIVITDKAGNKTTKSYNIVVAGNETNNNTVKPIVGTILIVVASLILVGVVAYFVITGRKKGAKKGSKNNKRK